MVKRQDLRSPVSIGIDLGARVTSIGLEFALPAVMGHLLDRWLDTSPWFTASGAILGMVIGMMHVLRLPAELARAENRGQPPASPTPHDRSD